MYAAFGPNLTLESSTGKRGDQEYGVLTLSKRKPLAIHHLRFPIVSGDEPRGYVEIALDITGVGEIRIFNTHLEVGRDDLPIESARQRRLQAEIIADRIRDLSVSSIMMGDFNCEPVDSETKVLIGDETGLVDAWACATSVSDGFTLLASPSVEPSRRICYILVADRIPIAQTLVVRTPETRLASDHFPVVADLQLPIAHPPNG